MPDTITYIDFKETIEDFYKNISDEIQIGVPEKFDIIKNNLFK